MKARLVALLATCALFTGNAWGISAGQPLSAALDELQRSGLRVVYSSALVTPDMRVSQDPGRGAPEDIARILLGEHALALAPVRPGVFAVVRAGAAETPAPAQARPQVSAEEEPLEEVEVFASRYRVAPRNDAGAAELKREDIEALPGLDQDVLRVTKYLPGTATNGVSSRPYVRGGRQNELGVYYDGIPLFEPFHFKDFQGLLGVLDPAVVGSLDFYSGVLPARFGDRLSGVLDIVPRAAGADDTWIFGLSPLFASAVTSGRSDRRDIEWLGAARASVVGLVLNDLDQRVGDPDFTDALARFAMPVGEKGKLIAGWMLLDDSLDFHRGDDSEIARASYRDGTEWVRGEFDLDDTLNLRAALSHTERHTTRRGSIARNNAVGSVDDVRRHDATTARVELLRRAGNSQWVAGIEAQNYASEYEYRGDATFDPRFAAAFNRTDFAFEQNLDVGGDAYAAYLFDSWDVTDALTLSAGLRWDAQRYDGFSDSQLSPRLALEYEPNDRWRLRAALGRMYQAERPDELQIQDAEAIFHPVQRDDQAVISVERRFGSDWSVRTEAFQKRIADPLPIYENLLDALVPLPELEVDRVRVAPRASMAYGVESTLRWQPAERWAGWMAYSWTESEDEFPGFKRARTWDQRNAVNAGLSWIRRPWQLSGTVQWRSGWRRNVLDLVDPATGELALEPRNSRAYPRMISIDLRATWTFPLPASALHFYVDIGNAGNRQTPCCTGYTLTESDGAWSLLQDYDSTFPRYVLLGVNWEIP
ncbi:MAG TPA: TonB-dependent receptor [Steroidobacteraceae bacterium]|nr:TonB-dependent receptor [Steroidobacteraceae bacterium]